MPVPSDIDPRSVRSIYVGQHGKRLLIGCPKGHYDAASRRCLRGTRAVAWAEPVRVERNPMNKKRFTRAQRKAQARIAHASKATRRRWAAKAAATRRRNAARVERAPHVMPAMPHSIEGAHLAMACVPHYEVPISSGQMPLAHNPNWTMHRDRHSGQFWYGGKVIRARENNPNRAWHQQEYDRAARVLSAHPDNMFWRGKIRAEEDAIAHNALFEGGAPMHSNPGLDLDVAAPDSVGKVLRDAAQKYYESASELESAWQDRAAGRPWTKLTRVLEGCADRAEKAYPRARNPELLTVGLNPSKRRRKTMARKRRSGARRIKYRGKYYYYIQLISKFGKTAARRIFKSKCKRKSFRRAHATCARRVKALPYRGSRGSWKAMVKRYGVMGAKKHYRRRR